MEESALGGCRQPRAAGVTRKGGGRHTLLKRTGDAGQNARQRNTPGLGCDDTVAALRWNELLTTTPAVQPHAPPQRLIWSVSRHPEHAAALPSVPHDEDRGSSNEAVCSLCCVPSRKATLQQRRYAEKFQILWQKRVNTANRRQQQVI